MAPSCFVGRVDRDLEFSMTDFIASHEVVHAANTESLRMMSSPLIDELRWAPSQILCGSPPAYPLTRPEWALPKQSWAP